MPTYTFAVEPSEIPSLPIAGSDQRFAVHRIYCIGRNYDKHVREMGGDPKTQPPVFFMKPADAAVVDGGEVPYPPSTANLHHEVELVIALNGGGADVEPSAALDLVFGYAVGIDLTRRDLQDEAKAGGRPWDSSKGFDASAPVGPIIPKADCRLDGEIVLKVNGAIKQSGSLSDMIWSVPEIISEASRLWRLRPGDLIFTGTPDGVGPLLRGDRVEGEIAGVGSVGFVVG